MRFSLVLLLFLVMASFTYKCKSVSVIDATKRTWVSGAPGGKSGITFTIKLLVKPNQKVEFPNVWMGERAYLFELYPATGDTILLTYNKVNGQAEESSSGSHLPMEYKGEALIHCVLNGKAQYLTVKSFRSLESLKGE